MQATKLVLHFQMRWHGTAQLRGRRDAIAGVSLSRNRRFFSGQRGSQGRLPGETAFTAAESTPQALQTPDSAEQEASIETVTRSDTDKLRSNVVSTAPMGDGATRMRGTRSSSSSGGRKVQGPGSGSRVSKVCPLPGKEVDRAARLAALNSYVYTVPPNELDQKLGKAGLRLLAQGHNIYTRWFVAEGRLPHVLARRPSESKEDSEAEAALTPLTAEPRPFDRKTRQLQLKLEPELGSDWGIERLVFTRGVVWRDPNVKLPSLWQELANAWPKPFAESHIDGGEVVVHRGVEKIAVETWEQLLPWVLDVPVGMPLTFAGHSLGGALSLIMTCKARIKLRLPGDLLRCYTFGAPGVMAHREGGGGDRVCRVMGLDPGRILCFCLDDDPVPRAMLAVDPAYSMLRQSQFGQRLLSWRQSLWGEGPLTLTRFLFEPIGRHFLIRWNSASGSRLVEVGEGEAAVKLEEAMRIEVEHIMSDPTRLIKLMTDHNQGAYVSELLMAARQQLKAERSENMP